MVITEILERRLFLNDLSYFKHYFILFNFNEHVPVRFVEWARSGSRVGHLRFFCLHRISCLDIPTATIEFVAVMLFTQQIFHLKMFITILD